MYQLCVTCTFFLLPVGSDFSDVDQVFQLISTQLTYNFNITVVNDDILEELEDFFVNLTRVTQVEIIDITPDMATVNIADDDGK